MADDKRLLSAVAEDLSSYRRTAESDPTEWGEPDAEILTRTGPDPDPVGLAEHTVAHTVLPDEQPALGRQDGPAL